MSTEITKDETAAAEEARPPFPPFSLETAKAKVRAAENGWNGRNPQKVAMAYTPDTVWRNRSEFLHGRDQVVEFLSRKWSSEIEYRLCKELWAYSEDRIAVRFAYEWHNASGQWFRSYGNENWEFAKNGLMRRRIASINDLPIEEASRLFRWELGIRPDSEKELSEFGL
ncbi:MAG: DUF1348 family protein [Myxococcota bacterium]